MLQKRREEYHRSIRRSKLDKIFEAERKVLIQNMHHNISAQELAILKDEIGLIVIFIKEGNIAAAEAALAKMRGYMQSNRDSLDITPILHPLNDLTTNILRGSQAKSEEDDEESSNQSLVLPIQVKLQLLCCILACDCCVKQEVQQHHSIKARFSNIWEIVQLKLHHNSLDGDYPLLKLIFEYWLQLLKAQQLLVGLPSEEKPNIYEILNHHSFGSQLCSLIELGPVLTIHSGWLLELLDLWLKAQVMLQPPKGVGVFLKGMDSGQKLKYLVFCVSFIEREQQEHYGLALSIIITIMQMHQYLCEELDPKYICRVAALIQHPDRLVQQKALQLLNDIIYYSEYYADYLIKEGILDLLHKRLFLELQQSSQDTSYVVNKCSYIVSNLLMSENKEMREMAIEHHIWELLYENMYPESKLFPMVSTFQYFFFHLGRKRTMKYLQGFLYGISTIDLSHHPVEASSFKRTILKINHQAKEFWSDKDEDTLISLLEKYQLVAILDQICAIET